MIVDCCLPVGATETCAALAGKITTETSFAFRGPTSVVTHVHVVLIDTAQISQLAERLKPHRSLPGNPCCCLMFQAQRSVPGFAGSQSRARFHELVINNFERFWTYTEGAAKRMIHSRQEENHYSQ